MSVKTELKNAYKLGYCQAALERIADTARSEYNDPLKNNLASIKRRLFSCKETADDALAEIVDTKEEK